MEVALVHWPVEADRRTQLEHDKGPRLLLVEHGVTPPQPSDCLEDWIRVPASDEDVRTRMTTLSIRARAHRADSMPSLDEYGVLRFADRWVSLPPVEAKLTRAFLERFGAVTRRDVLTCSAWPEGPPARNVLDVHVLRLRRRLCDVGLTIKTVRSRGYVLEASAG
jgi:DNA-binding response OmpR family regulator